jgi:hypothetical protein
MRHFRRTKKQKSPHKPGNLPQFMRVRDNAPNPKNVRWLKESTEITANKQIKPPITRKRSISRRTRNRTGSRTRKISLSRRPLPPPPNRTGSLPKSQVNTPIYSKYINPVSNNVNPYTTPSGILTKTTLVKTPNSTVYRKLNPRTRQTKGRGYSTPKRQNNTYAKLKLNPKNQTSVYDNPYMSPENK